MPTPESKIKKLTREVLDAFDCYYFIPVQMGYGPAGLDFHCSVNVRGWEIAFWVETKDRGKDPTPRQWELIGKLRKRGAKVFIIDDYYTLKGLRTWLEKVTLSKPMGEPSPLKPVTPALSGVFPGGSVKTR